MADVVGRRARVVRDLCRSHDPAIQWRTRALALGKPRTESSMRALEARVKESDRVRTLLTQGLVPHRSGQFGGVYRYWQGIHWGLLAIAELGYPPNDPTLAAIIERALSMWLLPKYDTPVQVDPSTPGRSTGEGVPLIAGRYRRCASQQGAALLYATRLGYADRRARRLSALLRRWQWPDGGWNCARSPEATTSSFMETLLPLRGLAAYAAAAGSPAARRSALHAAEVFLQRGLFRRRRDGRTMRPDFLRLHYPLYWHYDVLGGLKAMAELGVVGDPRCREALDWLESRELPAGGWPCDRRFYRVSDDYRFGCEYQEWGATNSRRPNEWVTTDALYVLRSAGRWTPS